MDDHTDQIPKSGRRDIGSHAKEEEWETVDLENGDRPVYESTLWPDILWLRRRIQHHVRLRSDVVGFDLQEMDGEYMVELNIR